MNIILHSDVYKAQVIDLILNIQNNEAKIDLSLDEQPDLKDINRYYKESGGVFYLAVENGSVIGTIGLILRENGCAILKKFFVKKEFRGQKTGLHLYQALLNFAMQNGVKTVILDTPSVAKRSHAFYEKAGFRKVEKAALPIEYTYPDRDCALYMLCL